MITIRRAAVAGATALVGIAVLAGCSSSSGSASSSASSSASASDSASSSALPPIFINPDTTTVDGKVGDHLDILVADNDLGSVQVSVDKPDLIEVTQAKEDGSATFNPGGTLLAPGTATLTIAYQNGTTQTVTVNIAG